jgi:ABC-type multidrug transport system fused ATPase/permease subunit
MPAHHVLVCDRAVTQTNLDLPRTHLLRWRRRACRGRSWRAAWCVQKGLDSTLEEGGSNLSVGQRQLLCMARALLKRTTVLLMDEATSNVDHDTDSLIQRTLRSAFKNVTIVAIAHRVHTIVDSDKILMLDAGRVVEFDAPAALLRRPGSKFAALVGDAGGGIKVGTSSSDAALESKSAAQVVQP